MDHTDQIAQPHEQESQPISYSAILAACVYRADGKCRGMLTPKRLHILHQKYNKTKSAALHRDVSPPPESFASHLVGLFQTLFEHKARATRDSKKMKKSFHHVRPPHVIVAFKHYTAVTKEKMASPLDFIEIQTSHTTGVATQVTQYLMPSLTVSPPLSLASLFVIPSMTWISCA